MTHLQNLIEYLETFITPERKNQFNRVIQNRTRYITVVLEDIYQPHNASAVLRSCDCFGIQDAHIIENTNPYHINPDVTLGSHKWLTIFNHTSQVNNTPQALNQLKKKGYRIVATTPHEASSNLHSFNYEAGKLALLFGNELNGLSDEALKNADEYLSIPMYGFTESLNISVSAAILLQYLSHVLRMSSINWQLTNQEKLTIKLEWLKKSINHSDQIIKRYASNS